jgi:hypothetical protein
MATTQRTHDSNASTGAGVLFAVGATALGVFSASRPLVGVAVYVAAATASAALWYRSGGGTDGDLEEGSPADSTLALVGMSAAVVFPALVAADGLGYFAWSGLTTGIAFSVAGLFAVYGVVSLWTLWRRER